MTRTDAVPVYTIEFIETRKGYLPMGRCSCGASAGAIEARDSGLTAAERDGWICGRCGKRYRMLKDGATPVLVQLDDED
ncbi:MAG: hypothetical protein OXG35_32255 [Acidobacteria bacterium]|nr:hypothetical protein [Acidobacteriota bacterium]